MTSTFTRLSLTGLGYVLGYLALDYASFAEPYRDFGNSPWNPSAGLSLTLAVMGGQLLAPLLIVAPLSAELIFRPSLVPLWANMAAAIVVGGVYFLAGAFLKRPGIFDPRLGTIREVVVLLVVAVVAAAATAIGYLVILIAAGLLKPVDIILAVSRFFMGDIIGVLVVAPIAFSAATLRPWPRPSWENLFQLAAIVMILSVIFNIPSTSAFRPLYLLFFPLIWVALRQGLVGATVTLAVIQFGFVAFLKFYPDTAISFIALQGLMVALAVTGLLVGALVNQQQAAARRLRMQQTALKRALRLRSVGETAAFLAHELNQPLTAISTYAGVADDAVRQGQTAQALDMIAKLRMQCERANEIVRSTRNILRHDPLSLKSVELRPLLWELQRFIADELSGHGITLKIDVPPTLPFLRADSVQLQQALHNLVHNSIDAIAATSRGGQITISARVIEGRKVAIEVADTGPGFSSLLAVSEPAPFVTTKLDGSGLGLTVARSVAESHGGSFSIERAGPGAVVRLNIPLARDEA